MITAALFLLDKEWAIIDRIVADDADPEDVLLLKIAMTYSTAPIWGGVAMMPYWKLHQQSARLGWAVKDVRHTRDVTARFGRTAAKYRTLTYWNWFPNHRAFAARGGLRWGAAKVGSRFIPYVGWALFAYDLWNVGKWIGEKTSPH